MNEVERIKQMQHDIAVLNDHVKIMNAEIRDLRSRIKSEQLLQGMADISQEIESEGWIPHTGNECPVHPKTEILIKICGVRMGVNPATAGGYHWDNFGDDSISHYKITKAYGETKLKLKLIDWGMEGMEGCMTNEGKLFQSETSDRYAVVSSNRVVIQNSDLRLVAPKHHEGWQSALNFKDVNAVIEKLRTQCVVEVRIAIQSKYAISEVIAFRVTGLAEGYTDDPSKPGV